MKKTHIDKKIFFYLICFYIISITSIFSFSKFISSNVYTLALKQTLFYAIGILLIFFIKKINFKKLVKYNTLIYICLIILLGIVLIFGEEINGTKAWFKIPLLGTFQPSEFMKISLILTLSNYINENEYKKDLSLLINIFIIILIPSILTFLEPDTGAVIIYFIITLAILLFSKIKKRWLIILGIIVTILISLLLYIYNNQQEIFINIFGNSMFYRLDRLFDWKSSSGMQLNNSLIAVGSSPIIGNGLNNILIYFPEGHTDFIFTSLTSIFGLIGALILIILLISFDFYLLNKIKQTKNKTKKNIIVATVSILLFQQIENIAMTIGLLPITGITLPFISYGGSSLISYMILLGLII